MPTAPTATPATRRRQLYRLLGDLPSRRRPIRILERRSHGSMDGYEVEYILFEFNGREPVPAYYIRPAGRDGEPLPAVLYNHWHGGDYPLGKNGFIHGFAGHPGLRPWAAELAMQGIAGLCIDHWCFGERPSRQRGESAVAKEMLWRGQTLWGHMLYDSLRALDWLAAQPNIDATRLGTIGMSMGSTMAWWLAALDPRVAVCVDLCCLTEFNALIRAGHVDYHSLYYYVPGLLKQFTTGHINALIAPRPHLSLAGNLDELTPPDGLDQLDGELRTVYAAAGAPDNWKLFRQEIGHCETPDMRQEILAFLRQHLAQPQPR
jgi:dienelactone hydrolase